MYSLVSLKQKSSKYHRDPKYSGSLLFFPPQSFLFGSRAVIMELPALFSSSTINNNRRKAWGAAGMTIKPLPYISGLNLNFFFRDGYFKRKRPQVNNAVQ